MSKWRVDSAGRLGHISGMKNALLRSCWSLLVLLPYFALKLSGVFSESSEAKEFLGHTTAPLDLAAPR